MELTIEQQAEVLSLLARFDPIDDGRHLRTLEHALRLALEATVDDFLRWERLEAGGPDEFTLSESDLAEMDDAGRLAYVARLLRTIALMYGVSTEFSAEPSPLGFEHNEGSIADLLRGLNDMALLR